MVWMHSANFVVVAVAAVDFVFGLIVTMMSYCCAVLAVGVD